MCINIQYEVSDLLNCSCVTLTFYFFLHLEDHVGDANTEKQLPEIERLKLPGEIRLNPAEILNTKCAWSLKIPAAHI